VADPAQLPLLQPADLVYSGAFRLPRGGPTEQESFAYGGSALAFDAPNNALFLAGHAWYQRVAEVTIPPLATGPALNTYPVATLRQPFVDVFDGKMSTIGPGSTVLGGMLVWGDALIVTDYLYYDASASQVASHFRTSPTWSARTGADGPYQVGTTAGFVSGYMTPIPQEWRGAFGGPALTGNCCLSIISRTSFGPSVSVFDPADVGVKDPGPATMLLGYPASHAALGQCADSGTLFNCTAGVAGVVFPEGTRSVLFFGRQGTGSFCYGEGTADPNAASETVCYDPSNSSKGSHAYPYTYYVWAYDALDLAAVKQGALRPWDVHPYATWSFDLPFAHDSRMLQGATYDPSTRRIYLSAAHGDGTSPLIHAFTVASSSGG
jgi:hypothetical protein